jgi:O-antigen/teichoic acid export membrane protein
MTAPDAALAERKEVAAGAGLASFGLLVSGIFNLLLLTVLTRALSKADFGLFSLVYLIQDTTSALLPLGLPAALAYFVPRRGDPGARALGFWTGGLLFLLAIPAALILVVAAPLISSDPQSWVILRLLGLYILGDFPGQALPAYLLARRSYRAFFIVTLAFAISRFASLAIPAALGASLTTIMGWFLLVAGLRLLMFLWYFLFAAEGSLSRKHVSARELLAYGFPLSLSTLVGKLNVQADKYGVALAASKEVLAVYTVGAVELPLVSSLAYSVTNTLVPTLTLTHAKGDRDGFLRYWHGSVEKIATIMMPVFFYFLILAEPAMRLLFSAEFAAAAVPFRVYLFLLPLRLCSYGSVLRALGETKPILTTSLVALAINAVLIFPLYHLMGIAGPALASDLALFVNIVLLLGRIRVHLNLDWSRVLPFKHLLRTTLVAAVAALPLLAVLRFVKGDLLQLLIGLAVLTLIYLVLGRRTHVIAKGDLHYLVGLATLRGLWDRRAARSDAR